MNRITYLDYVFTDEDIAEGNVFMENSLVSESLGADTFSFSVIDRNGQLSDYLYSLTDELTSSSGDLLASSFGTVSDILPYKYGTPLSYYHNNVLIGKFYLKSIKRTAKNRYKFAAQSAIGQLINIKHYGGVYVNETVSSIIASILSLLGMVEGTDYTIDGEIENLLLSGWLGIDNCRNQLQQVCLAVGCAVLKEENGSLHFSYNQNIDITPIASDRLYVDGAAIDYTTQATLVTVTEHAFYKTNLDEVVELYNDDNDVTGKVITFDAPCYDLEPTGTIVILASGDNYAIISGAGTVTGKKYTHTTKELSVNTNVDSAPYEVKVENATLVTALNSYYVALRIANYYGSAEEVSYNLLLKDDERNYTGQLVRFTDPFGDEIAGYIKTMDITISGKLKANCKIATNFTMGPFGANFVDQILLWSGNGEGELDRNMVSLNGRTGVFRPADYGLQGQRVRVVVFSSAHGGTDGTDGTAAYTQNYAVYNGLGGKKGTPGKGITYYSKDIELTEDEYTISLGEGGEHNTDTAEHSVFGSIDSDMGNYTEGGYLNIITQRIYGDEGVPGYDGADGGILRGYYGSQNHYCADNAAPGGNLLEWVGGLGGKNYRFTSSWSTPSGDSHKAANYTAGGSGGGACYGSDGQNGTDTTGSGSFSVLGRGGDGASVPAELYPKQAILGRGGGAGSGGAGGGTAGNETRYNYSSTSINVGTHGRGGKASPGGKGSDGFILILSPIELAMEA